MIIALAILVIMGTPGNAGARTETTRNAMKLELTLATDQTVFAPGESIPFTVTLRNDGTSPVSTVSLGNNGLATSVVVKRDSGDEVFALNYEQSMTQRGEVVEIPGFDPRVTVGPGESVNMKQDVQCVQRLDTPGKYQLIVKHAWTDIPDGPRTALETGPVEFEIRSATIRTAQVSWQWMDGRPRLLRTLVRDGDQWFLRHAAPESPDAIESACSLPNVPSDTMPVISAVSEYDVPPRALVAWLQSDQLQVQFLEGGVPEGAPVATAVDAGWDLVCVGGHDAADNFAVIFRRKDGDKTRLVRARFDAAGAQQAWDEISIGGEVVAAGLDSFGELAATSLDYDAAQDETILQLWSPATGALRKIGRMNGRVLEVRFLPGRGETDLRLVILTKGVTSGVFRTVAIDTATGKQTVAERAMALPADVRDLLDWDFDATDSWGVLYKSEGKVWFDHTEGHHVEVDVPIGPTTRLVMAPEARVFCLYEAGNRGLLTATVMTPHHGH